MRVVVGRIARVHGVRGEVNVDVRTDEPDRRFAVGAAMQVGETGPTLTVRRSRSHQGRLLVTFDEIGDRDAAEALRGSELTVDAPPDERPDDPEEFYDHQLVGLDVRTADGSSVGTVTAVAHLPGQDTLAVRTEDGAELHVPFVRAIVSTVEVAAGYLQVEDVPGLLDPDAAESAHG